MKFILALIILLASCVPHELGDHPDATVEIAYDCPEENTHWWNGFHWRSDNLTIEVVDLTGNSEFLVEEVVGEWSSFDIPMTLIYSRASRNTDFPTITVHAENGNGWLGLAIVYPDEDRHIQGGAVKIHPLMLSDDRYTRAGLKHVMCQELGHTLGLGHIKFETCMDDCSWIWREEEPEMTWIDCINDQARETAHEHDVCQLDRMLHEESSVSSQSGPQVISVFPSDAR
ncbi:MAG: hypothetical protein ACW99G_14765 [Candidatus Thorarchaeota archaeon]